MAVVIGIATLVSLRFLRKSARQVEQETKEKPVDSDVSVRSRTAFAEARATSAATMAGTPLPLQPAAGLHQGQDINALARKAERSPHRLEWKTEEHRPSDTVFDLCDDDQAIMAGLDSSQLQDQRYRLNIDCSTGQNRYGYVPPGDTLRQASGYKEALEALKKFAEKKAGEREPGILMGHFGPSWRDLGLELQSASDGFGVAPSTFLVAGGVSRGVFANVSEQVAHNVVLAAGNSIVRYPLSVQPGETTVFEFPEELDEMQLAGLAISATFASNSDPNRSLLITGTPGNWSGRREKLAELNPPVDLLHVPEMTNYFETQLWFKSPSSHPDADAGRVIRAPVVIAASLDSQRKVIDIVLPRIVMRDGHNSPVAAIAIEEAPSVGFVVSPNASTLIISAGGEDYEKK
jgi:hypothetical protein